MRRRLRITKFVFIKRIKNESKLKKLHWNEFGSDCCHKMPFPSVDTSVKWRFIMDKKAKTAPSIKLNSSNGQASFFAPSPPDSNVNMQVIPARPTRAMTCLDLTFQCVMFQDKNGTNSVENCNGAAALNMNQRINQMKAQKELTSVHMYSQRMVRLKMTQKNRRQVIPWFGATMVVQQGLG